MSRKNNINTDHYKTKGRDRPNNAVIHETHKRVLTASQSRLSENSVDAIRSGNTISTNPSSRLRHLQRLRRRRKIKGLSARQLWERKNSQRAYRYDHRNYLSPRAGRQHKQDKIIPAAEPKELIRTSV
jgi:hypothetical protein